MTLIRIPKTTHASRGVRVEFIDDVGDLRVSKFLTIEVSNGSGQSSNAIVWIVGQAYQVRVLDGQSARVPIDTHAVLVACESGTCDVELVVETS